MFTHTCLIDDDEFELQCLTCNMLVHYGCTQLCVQISHFLTEGIFVKNAPQSLSTLGENTMKSKNKLVTPNESLEKRLEIMSN